MPSGMSPPWQRKTASPCDERTQTRAPSAMPFLAMSTAFIVRVSTMAAYSGFSFPMLTCCPCLVVRPAIRTNRSALIEVLLDLPGFGDQRRKAGIPRPAPCDDGTDGMACRKLLAINRHVAHASLQPAICTADHAVAARKHDSFSPVPVHRAHLARQVGVQGAHVRVEDGDTRGPLDQFHRAGVSWIHLYRHRV